MSCSRAYAGELGMNRFTTAGDEEAMAYPTGKFRPSATTRRFIPFAFLIFQAQNMLFERSVPAFHKKIPASAATGSFQGLQCRSSRRRPISVLSPVAQLPPPGRPDGKVSVPSRPPRTGLELRKYPFENDPTAGWRTCKCIGVWEHAPRALSDFFGHKFAGMKPQANHKVPRCNF